jgi:hypothetical protein
MKRNIKVVVHYPKSGGHKIYFSTDLDMSAKDIIEYYRTRFQIEFCFYEKYIIMQSYVVGIHSNKQIV